MKKFTFIVIIALLNCSSVSAQKGFFKNTEESQIDMKGLQRKITPEKYRLVSADMTGLKSFLWSLQDEKEVLFNRTNAAVVSLPMPNGNTASFHVWKSSVQEPELEEKFPGIRTFAGQGIDDPYATIRFDITDFGFHAQILSVNGNIYIDPFARGNTTEYISYYTADNKRYSHFICEVPENNISSSNRTVTVACRGTQLYKYRLAVACTGEYAVAVGGTTASLLHSAIVTSVNRVNGVYENEVAVRLILVANNNLVEYLNAATDPFSGNNNAGTLINESQTVITNIIGAANYDIGHTFSTGGGGLANLGVVCASGKAKGITGSPSPVGDSYDIDYVAHEMGHQFGANHTFNSTSGSCGGGNRASGEAYEVGSGTTIMAYAGICTTDDIQLHSDPFFHAISYYEITAYLESGATCKVATPTGNTLPVITAMNNNNANIPLSTPFTLSATASDANSDAITYCWEEWDLGGSGAWNSGATSKTAPLFKSRVPKTTGSRTFPDINYILANYSPAIPDAIMGGLKGETLASVARPIKFKLTVRDNRAGGSGVVSGGNGCQSNFTGVFQVNTIAGTGPFIVTAPNGGEIWASGATKTITWNVAGTNLTPISTANVKISLSTDGGYTYPFVILASTPNDGTQAITVPTVAVTTNLARIKIEAINNIYFDISNANFTITAPGAKVAPVATTTLTGETTAFNAQVFPNPNKGDFQLKIKTGIFESSTAKIAVLDVYGNIVDQFEAKNSAGEINKSIFNHTLANGVYSVRYTIAGKTGIVRMIINK